MPAVSCRTLWLMLSFLIGVYFFIIFLLRSQFDVSVPELCSLDFCLPLASHVLLYKIPKWQTMNIDQKKKKSTCINTPHLISSLSASCTDLKMEKKKPTSILM